MASVKRHRRSVSEMYIFVALLCEVASGSIYLSEGTPAAAGLRAIVKKSI